MCQRQLTSHRLARFALLATVACLALSACGGGAPTGQVVAKVDKDEGYEVADFIQALMNDHGKTGTANVHAAENALQAPQLSTVTSRVDLYKAVKADVRW